MSSRKNSPSLTVFSLVSVAAALVVYAADDVRGWVIGSSTLSEKAWALSAADKIEALSEQAGLPAFRQRLEGLVRPPADRYVILQKPAPKPPPEALVVGPAPSEGPKRKDEPSVSAKSAPTPIRNVLLIGASSMQHQPGIELERLFGTVYRDMTVHRLGKVATGLARPDVFDWPKKAQELVDEHHPELVIANFGGNDAQGMVIGKDVVKFGTPEWDAEYARRLLSLIDASRSRGAKVAVMGMPIMRSAKSSERVVRVNEITKRTTEQAGETYVSTWEISADEKGAYREAVEWKGSRGPMRQSDGWHFTRLGGEYVAAHLLEAFEQHFYLPQAEASLADSVPRELDSSALGRRASYIAYLPRPESGAVECYPTLFLLHGAGGSYRDWPASSHRELQRLSMEHGLIIVTPDGTPQGWYLDSPRMPKSQIATHILDEVLPDVEARFPVTDLRSIAGLSAGGHGAITFSLKHPGTFASASSMSGVLDLPAAASRQALMARLGPYPENVERWEASSALHLVERSPEIARKIPMLVTVGSSDHWAERNRHFAARLEALGVPHRFEESPGGHDWKYWASQLERHVAWHAERLREASAGSGKDSRACGSTTASRR